MVVVVAVVVSFSVIMLIVYVYLSLFDYCLLPSCLHFDVALSVERIETPFQLSSASLESDDLELLFLLQNLSLGDY